MSAFAAAVRSNPLAMNAATGAVLCTASDIIAQKIESGSDGGGLDYWRLGSAGLIGGGFGGLVYPFAYARLDALWPGAGVLTVLKKSIVEIATVGIFVNSVSIGTRGGLAGRRLAEVVQHVRSEMPTVTLNDVRVWLPYNMVAFAFVPAVLRPTCTALMEASWQTYISLRAHDYGGACLPGTAAVG